MIVDADSLLEAVDGEGMYEDYSMVTPFERAVGAIAQVLEAWSSNHKLTEGAPGETCAGSGDRVTRIRSVELCVMGGKAKKHRISYFSAPPGRPWPSPIEGGELGSHHVSEEDSDAGRTRAAMKTTFGVERFVLLEDVPHTPSFFPSADEKRARERVAWLASAACIAALEASVPRELPVFAKSEAALFRVVRGSVVVEGCCTEFETLARSDDTELRLARVIEALRRRLPNLSLDDASVSTRFAWIARSDETCGWRQTGDLGTRSSQVADLLRGGRDGGAGVRRGQPLWGPRLDPVKSLDVVAEWHDVRVSGVLDEPGAPFSTFDPLDAPSLTASLTLRRTQGPAEAPLSRILESLAAALTVSFPDDAVFGAPCRPPRPSSSSSGIRQLEEMAQYLVDRTGTLKPSRLDEYLADLFSDYDDDDVEIDITDHPTLAAHLAVRMGSLSSLEAMADLWRGFVGTYRSIWEEKRSPPLRFPPRTTDEEDAAVVVYVGSKRVTGRALAALQKEREPSDPLTQVLNVLDAAILVAGRKDDGSSSGFGYQAPPPEHGCEALEMARLPPEQAAHLARRRALALVASDMAIFKTKSDEPDDFEPRFFAAAGGQIEEDLKAELWDAVAPTEPHLARPFFLVDKEAEHALHRLEIAHPSWVFAHCLRVAANAAIFVLDEATSLADAKRLASVRGALSAATKAVDDLIASLPSDDDTAKPIKFDPTFVPAAVDAIAAAETHLARAVSVLRKFDDPDLAEQLLLARVIEVHDDSRPALLGARTSTTPDSRDYLLFCEAETSDDLVKLPHRVYAHCDNFGAHLNTVFSFAISDPT